MMPLCLLHPAYKVGVVRNKLSVLGSIQEGEDIVATAGLSLVVVGVAEAMADMEGLVATAAMEASTTFMAGTTAMDTSMAAVVAVEVRNVINNRRQEDSFNWEFRQTPL